MLHINVQAGKVFLLVFLFLLSLFLIYLSYRQTAPPLSRSWRALCIALRSASTFLLCFLLLTPVFRFSHQQVQTPYSALLVDVSASMGIRDRYGQRLENVKSFLQSPFLKQWWKKGYLECFTFERDLQAVSFSRLVDSLEVVESGTTNLVKAYQQVKRVMAGKNLQSIVLITDGVATEGGSLLQATANFPPVFSIGVGDSLDSPDLALDRIEAGEITYVGKKFFMDLWISETALPAQSTVVRIQDKSGQELFRRTISVGTNTQIHSVRADITFSKPGFYLLEIGVETLPQEFIKDNNTRMHYVHVLERKKNILLLGGAPRPDYAFLRRTLTANPDYKVETHCLVPTEQSSFYSWLKEQYTQNYDLVIIDNLVPGGMAQGEEEQLLRTLLQKGWAGFFIAGARIQPATEYPFNLWFPFRIQKEVWKKPFTVKLSESGRSHKVTRLLEQTQSNLDCWAEFPPLLQAFSLEQVGNTSMTLLENPLSSSPVMLAWKTTTAKYLFLSAWTFWRWQLLMGGMEGRDSLALKFWNNAVEWLTSREDLKRIQLYPDQKKYLGGTAVQFEGEVYDETFEPVSQAFVQVTLRKKKGDPTWFKNLDLLPLSDQAGGYRGTAGVLPAGDYTYHGEAILENHLLGTEEGEFTVEHYNQEYYQPRLNVDLLKKLSGASGGKFLIWKDFSKLDSLIHFEPRMISEKREIEIWHHPFVLILLVSLLSGEWFIRKRKRLP